MDNPIFYIPIVTTLLSAAFAVIVARRWHRRGQPPHLLWWAIGIALFGVGTFMEGFTALFGWDEAIFRAWYVSGALLGGAPLAQGTAYLLLSRQRADRLAMALVSIVAVATVFVLLTPVNSAGADEHKLSGSVIEWSWVRGFSPFINTYAFVLLVGGAVHSAMRYSELRDGERVAGNLFIAVGALLPGIGGSFTRFGHTEVLYVTEFVGIIFIYAGFRLSTRPSIAADRAISAEPGAVVA